MVWPYFVPLMSARFFHSRDLDGLEEALTDQPERPSASGQTLFPDTGCGGAQAVIPSFMISGQTSPPDQKALRAAKVS